MCLRIGNHWLFPLALTLQLMEFARNNYSDKRGFGGEGAGGFNGAGVLTPQRVDTSGCQR
jgi:hypothetical protein